MAVGAAAETKVEDVNVNATPAAAVPTPTAPTMTPAQRAAAEANRRAALARLAVTMAATKDETTPETVVATATTAVATEPATAATATETVVRRCTAEPWRRGRNRKWYGVRRGKDGTAIYDAWFGSNGAAEATAGVSGARYRAFAADVLGETGAERWAAAAMLPPPPTP